MRGAGHPAGCGGGDDDQKSAAITLQLFGDAEELKVYGQLTDAYRKKTGTKVTVVAVPDRDAHIQKLTTAFGAGRPPDAFLVNYRNFAPFAARKVIDPAGPRLDSSKQLKRDQFYDAPLEAFEYGRTLQCMPQNTSSLVVYFNRDLFRRAGVAEPREGWTMSDLKSHLERSSSRDSCRISGTPWESSPPRSGPRRSYGPPEASWWTTTRNPSRFTLDTPTAEAGLRDLLALADFGPSELEARAKPLDERFLTGELAMFMGSRAETPGFRTIKKFDWDVAPFPTGRERAGVLHSDAYCIAKGSRSDAAWRFASSLSAPRAPRSPREVAASAVAEIGAQLARIPRPGS